MKHKKLQVNFQIHFRDLPEPISDVWESFADHLRANKCLSDAWNVAQREKEGYARVPPEEVGRIIEAQGWTGFHVTTLLIQRNEINFALRPTYLVGAPRTDFGHSLFMAYEKGAKVPDNWAGVIEKIMEKFPAFGCTIFASSYYGWQTTTRERWYERNYGPVPEGFKRKLAPSPLPGRVPDEIHLDTSLNPGRYQLDDKNQFRAVAAELWLGEHFWDYAPCTKEEVLASDIFLEKRDTPHYLYIKSWPHAFTRPDGEQGRVQQKLWRLIFKEDCEWPPGSGGISDEPVGGPPELMPDNLKPPSKS